MCQEHETGDLQRPETTTGFHLRIAAGLSDDWGPPHGLPEFDSVTQCLAAHFAALEDDISGLTTCFAWFECADLATTISGPNAMCAGESIVLDAGLGYESYLWSPGGETARTITVGPLIDTLFEVEVQDEWGCHGFDDHQVVVAPAPLPAIAGPAGICAGASAMLDAGEGWDSYLWSPGGEIARTIFPAPVSDTAYSVRVTDGAGCPGTSADHLLEVWQLPEPLILGPSKVVLGYSVVLDAGAGYVSYLWSTNETLRMIEVSPVENTIYSVNVTDFNDCSEPPLQNTCLRWCRPMCFTVHFLYGPKFQNRHQLNSSLSKPNRSLSLSASTRSWPLTVSLFSR